MKHNFSCAPSGQLSFWQFFARWMRLRRDDMLGMLVFPIGMWLLLLAVVLVSCLIEQSPLESELMAVPTAMALVGTAFAGFIVGIGSAGVGFTLAVSWGQPRRYAIAAIWLSGLLYGAGNLLLAVLLQQLGFALGPLWGGQGSFRLLAMIPPGLWLLLLAGPTAAGIAVKATLRRFGPKSGGVLYLVFLFCCIALPRIDNVLGMDLRPAAFALVAAALLVLAAAGSVWLLRLPVATD